MKTEIRNFILDNRSFEIDKIISEGAKQGLKIKESHIFKVLPYRKNDMVGNHKSPFGI
jgi:Tfp pilus assembly pilus retraction ATPase PilT